MKNKMVFCFNKVRRFVLEHKRAVLFCLIMLGAAVFRMIYFAKLPPALNNDEASIGYDAWAMLKYGIDRNGTHLPVHHISWGSGQNALYSYLSMPFIALFGLNIFSVRIVSLLLGLSSVAVVYFFVKRFANTRTAFIAMGLTAISPWHILLSRWGLEANIFPAVFLFGAWLFAKGTEKPLYYIFGSFVLALSLYAYGTSYLVVPVVLFAIALYVLIKMRPKVKYVLLSAATFIVTALPIMLFVVTNKFNLGDIKIFGFTVPQLTGISRMSTAAGGTSLKNTIKNLWQILVLQDDGLLLNSVPGYGIVFLISIPFMLYGIYVVLSRKNFASVMMGAWLIAGLSLFFVYSDVNINRVNIIFLPLIIFTAYGINALLCGKKELIAVALCYATMFGGFFTYYCTEVKTSLESRTEVHIGEAVMKSCELAQGEKTIYYSDTFWVPYIYTLFYEQTPPQDYIDTVVFKDKNDEMQIVQSFTNHKFYVDELECGESGIYIMTDEEYTAFFERFSERISESHSIHNLVVAVME